MSIMTAEEVRKIEQNKFKELVRQETEYQFPPVHAEGAGLNTTLQAYLDMGGDPRSASLYMVVKTTITDPGPNGQPEAMYTCRYYISGPSLLPRVLTAPAVPRRTRVQKEEKP